MAKKTNAMRRLDQAKVSYEVRTFEVGDTHMDGTHVAETIGANPEQVFKTLVLENAQHDHFVFVIPVQAHLDMKQAAHVVGEKKLQLMPLDDLKRVTGYVRGGCSPIGMKTAFPTVFDTTMFDNDRVYVSAGQRGVQMGVDPKDLATLAKAHKASIITT